MGIRMDERIQLVEEIWDSIAEDADTVPLTEAQRQDLDRRLEAYAKDPSATQTWAEVREELERDA